MHRDIFESHWKQFKYALTARWGQLSGDRRGESAGGQILPASRSWAKVSAAGSENEESSTRRLVLRGALAMGCSLFLPISLSGCDVKKGASSTSGDPAGPPAGSGDPAAPATPGKVSQASVQYQAQPKGEQKCAGCMHFEAGSGTCKLVDGQVSPEGWCTLWAKNA